MKFAKQILLALVGLSALYLPLPGLAQVTFTVGNSGDYAATPIPDSLRDIITNQADDGDTVSIPSTVSKITLTSGEIKVLKSIAIQGAGAGTTLIDGNNNDRIFEIGNGIGTNPSVTIKGVTIQNGNAGNGGGIFLNRLSTLRLENSQVGSGTNPNTATNRGGGIFSDGSLTVVHSTIDGNLANSGGGVSCGSNSTVMLNNTTVSNNNADFRGGGVENTSCSMTLQGTSLGAGGCNVAGNTTNISAGGGIQNTDGETLIDTCTISGNTSSGGNGGGGVDNNESLTVLNSLITGNHALGPAEGGGGIFYGFGGIVNDVHMQIDNTTISNNDTTGFGGGIYSEDPGVITNTTISGNHANGINSGGGGVFSGGPLDISNTTIFGNDAKGSGGGIFNDTNLHLNNVTIANNTADKDGNDPGDGGGIAGFGSLRMRNTIVAGNFDKSGGILGGAVDKDCSTVNFNSLVIVSEGHNLIGVVDADCVISGDTSGNIINQPAGLDPNGLQANGSSGPLTVALVSGSLALGAADPATATATDERGVARPQPQSTAPDIGAFESAATPPAPVSTPTPMPIPISTPTSIPISTSSPAIDPKPGSGCSLTAFSPVDSSGWLSLLPLAVAGFVALRRRAE